MFRRRLMGLAFGLGVAAAAGGPAFAQSCGDDMTSMSQQRQQAMATINAMVGATSALLAEALNLARRGGLDVQTVMDVVAESAVASPLLQYKRAAVTTGDYTAAFSVSQMLKDFDLIVEAAQATSCEMPLAAGIRETYRAAVARGLGDRDFFVLTAENA